MKLDFIDYCFAIFTCCASFLILVVSVVMIISCCTGCTISFQNISTHGTATDLVDEDQRAEPDIKTDLTIPIKAI